MSSRFFDSPYWLPMLNFTFFPKPVESVRKIRELITEKHKLGGLGIDRKRGYKVFIRHFVFDHGGCY